MFSLVSGIVAATTTTAVGAFADGFMASLVCFAIARGSAKATLNLKK